MMTHFERMRAARLNRRVGGIADFNSYFSSDSNFAAKWNGIQAQLTAEGANSTDIDAAKSALADSFSQMSTQFGIDPTQALDAASSYVMTGKTIAGAVSVMSHLTQAQGASAIPQDAQIFTGTMIGLGVALGAVSAGVGAAIVGTVGSLLGVLQASGLFGGAAPGTTICPGVNCNPNPDFVVGCLCGWNDPVSSQTQISPGSPLWRSFPDPNNSADAGWFQSGSPTNLHFGPWKGADFGYSLTSNPAGPSRPIDMAFNFYAQGNPGLGGVEFLASPLAIENYTAILAIPSPPPSSILQPGSPLSLAFVTAWKANAEYALNGLQVQPDWQVLANTIRLWNRAHDGPTVALSQDSSSYMMSLVSDAAKGLGADQMVDPSGNILVNAGPIKTPPSVTALFSKSTPTATKVAAVALGIPATIALAAVVHSWATGHAIDWTFKKLWGGAKGLYRRVASGVRENPLELTERTTTTVQSLLFPRSRFTPAEARSWARQHGKRSTKTHVTGQYIRLRQLPPGDFARGSFRTIPFGDSGIKAVVGHLR